MGSTQGRVNQLQANLQELNASFSQGIKHAEARTAEANSNNNRLRKERNSMKQENERLWTIVNGLKKEVKCEKHKAAQLLSQLLDRIRVVQEDAAHLMHVVEGHLNEPC